MNSLYRRLRVDMRWVMVGAILLVCILWAETLVFQARRWGQPYQGFVADPWGVVSAASKYNGVGWQAGLRSFDVVVAANGQPWSDLQAVLQQTGVGGTVVYTVQRGDQTLDIPVQLKPIDLSAIAEITGGCLLFASLAMIVGIVVYRHNPDGYLNRVVLIYDCLWALIMWYEVAWHQDARMWSVYAIWPTANLAVACGLTFFWSYGADEVRRKFLAKTHLILLFWLFWGGYGLLLAASLYLALHSMRPEFLDFYQRLGRLFPGLSYPIITTVGKSAPLLLIAMRKSTSRLLRRQLLALLIGFVFAYVTSFCLWDFPLEGRYEPFVNLAWGNIVLVLYPLSVAYAVLRYQAFDIRVVIRKGLVYSILTAGLTAIFLLLSMAIGYLFQSWTGQQTFAAAVIPALLVAVMFRPAQGRVQTAVDRIFFRKEYEVRQTLTSFGRGLATLRDTGEVIRLVLDTMTSTLGAEGVSFWLLDSERNSYRPTPPAQTPDLAADGDLPFWLASERRPLLLPPSDASPQAGALRQIGAVLAVPLVAEQRLLGFLSLGTKRSGLLYNDDDLELLSNLAQSATLALENSRLHEERLSMLREQLARVTAAQEEERQRIARELHDGVGPALASLKLRLRTTGKSLGRDSLAALELNELADLA